MKRKFSVCFRVDGNVGLGLGHLSRCRSLLLELARLKACAFSIITRDVKVVRSFIHGADCKIYDFEKLRTSMYFDMLVTDVPGMTFKEKKMLEGFSSLNVSIDDEGSGLTTKDILIRPNLFKLPRPKELSATDYWSGSKHIMLHPDFRLYNADKNRRNKSIAQQKKIVVCFGGSDPRKITLRIIPLLKRLKSSICVTIILGPAFLHGDQARFLVGNDSRFSIIVNTVTIAEIMSKADIAIISGGTLLYETSSLGTPSVVISQNKGQEREAQIFHSKGSAISLGLSSVVSDRAIFKAIEQLVDDEKACRRMSVVGPRMVCPDGTHRIAMKLLHELRKKG